MIHSEIINSFTEEELGCLLYILNNVTPCGVEVDPNTLKSYKFDFLAKNLMFAKTKMNEDGVKVWENICKKMSIPIN